MQKEATRCLWGRRKNRKKNMLTHYTNSAMKGCTRAEFSIQYSTSVFHVCIWAISLVYFGLIFLNLHKSEEEISWFGHVSVQSKLFWSCSFGKDHFLCSGCKCTLGVIADNSPCVLAGIHFLTLDFWCHAMSFSWAN